MINRLLQICSVLILLSVTAIAFVSDSNRHVPTIDELLTLKTVGGAQIDVVVAGRECACVIVPVPGVIPTDVVIRETAANVREPRWAVTVRFDGSGVA